MQYVHVLSPPLSVGEVVTFKYDKFSRREAPVNVAIVRRRNELKWEDVVANSSSIHGFTPSLSPSPSLSLSPSLYLSLLSPPSLTPPPLASECCDCAEEK